MEKINFEDFTNNEIADLIVDNILSIRAQLEGIVLPKLNLEKFRNESLKDLINDTIGYLSADSSMGHKLLQSIIHLHALMQSIGFLYVVDLCEKNPDKSIDEMKKKFTDKVESNFYELVARIMAAKKEPGVECNHE